MKVDLAKYGELLISRPAGREAGLVFCAYQKPADVNEPILLDFTSVVVLAPSWMDEFLQTLESGLPNAVHCLRSDKPVVIATLKAIEREMIDV